MGKGERAENDAFPKKICTGDSLLVNNARVGKRSDMSGTIPRKRKTGQEIKKHTRYKIQLPFLNYKLLKYCSEKRV